MIGFELWPAKATVKLASETQPFATNGDWDAKNSQVIWMKTIIKDSPFPAFCYAFWSVPNANFQTKHFGSVILDGEDLAGYVLWRKGLSKADAEEWDEFVSGLRAGEDVIPKLESFSFSADRDAVRKGKKPLGRSLADTPRQLILSQLKGKDQKTQQ